MANFFKAVKNSIKHWYLPLLAGILFIAMGIWTFKEPVDSYVALAFLFSLSFIVSGAFETYFSIANRDVIDGWGWNLAMGLVTLIVGILMMMNPEISMMILPFYVGFVVLFRSINAISLSIDLKNYMVPGTGNLMAIGILGIILAIILLWNPGFAGLSIIIWTGIALIVIGAQSIMFSLKLKKINDIPSKISHELKKRYDDVENEILEELAKHID